MPSQDQQNILLPGVMGTAGGFNSASIVDAVPFVRLKKSAGSLTEGDLLLSMTLQEILSMRSVVGRGPLGNANIPRDMIDQYDSLKEELKRLQEQSTTTSVLNISKRSEIRRNVHQLVNRAFNLYKETKNASDSIRRAMVPSVVAPSEVEAVEAASIAANEQVMGLYIDTESNIGELTADSNILGDVASEISDMWSLQECED